MDESSFPEKGNQGLLFGKQVRCIRCGRPLSNENSQTLGMGPICAHRAKVEAGDTNSGDIFLFNPHIREKIVLKLVGGRVATNVPNAIGHQSGYGWGHGGGGPTNLAMNIVEIALAHTDYDTSHKVQYGARRISSLAWSLGHGFKAQFLVPMDKNGGEIEWETVLNWIHDRVNEEVNFESTS